MPMWGLSPVSCADEFSRTVIDFICNLSSDPEWAGHDIVLMGSSAGSWGALRSLIALGEAGLEEGVARNAMNKIKDVILLTPMSFFDQTTEELEEAGKSVSRLQSSAFSIDNTQDPWLSSTLVELVSSLWAHGPTAVPEIFASLPEHLQAKALLWKADTNGVSLSDPRFSPARGLDVLRRFTQAVPTHRPFRITVFHGTADILYPQSVKLCDMLGALGPSVIHCDFRSVRPALC